MHFIAEFMLMRTFFLCGGVQMLILEIDGHVSKLL